MKSLIFLFTILVLAGFSQVDTFAQEQQTETATTTQETQTRTQTSTVAKPRPFPDTLNVADQFLYAIDKSSNFREYKVIRQEWMSKLRSNVLDTLVTLKNDLKTSNNTVSEKSTEITSLQEELKNLQGKLDQKNSFAFLGFLVSKKAYDTIMWTIIISLFVALGIMIFAFRKSFAVTSQTRKDLNEVKDEFENFRKKALKSKEEAVRQLYDELNKYKNRS